MPSQAARTLRRRRRRGVLNPLPLPRAPTPTAPVRRRRAWGLINPSAPRPSCSAPPPRCRRTSATGSPTMTGQCEKSTHGRSGINREIRYETTWDTTAGFPHIDGERWLNLTWDSVSQAGDDELAWTGPPRALTGRGLLPGGGFRFSAGDTAAPDHRWSGWRQPAPARSAGAHHANGAEPVGLLGSDCGRDRPRAAVAPAGTWAAWRVPGVHATDDPMMIGSRGEGSGSPLRHWSSAIGMPLARRTGGALR